MDAKGPRKAKWLSKVFGRGSSTAAESVRRQEPSRDTPTTVLPSGSTSPARTEPVEDSKSSALKKIDNDGIEAKPSTTRQIAKGHSELLSTRSLGLRAAASVLSDDLPKSGGRYHQVQQNDLSSSSALLASFASMRSADLWEKAYAQLLKDEEQKDVMQKYEAVLVEGSGIKKSGSSLSEQMEIIVQQKIEVMKRKQWVVQWDQKPIVIREQAERIVKFVQTFSSLGTAIAQIDPIHAGIPWAGVCVILTLLLNDSTQQQATMDGLEEISRIVAKYTAIEDLYRQSCELDPNSEKNRAFELSILKVYSRVLIFQAKAALHFHQSTFARTMSNITKSVDWTSMLLKIKECDTECLAITSTTALANMGTDSNKIKDGLRELNQKWKTIQKIGEVLDDIQANWEKKQSDNAAILSWISDAQVGEDHERARNKLGARYWDAGQWFLQNPMFEKWKISRRGQFWLQGSVGTGKTSLASIVINDLIKAGDYPSIAFFYCSRGMVASLNNPTAIFRSLVAQLACSSDGEEIAQDIRTWYKRDAKRYTTGSRLSLTECENLLITLMKLRGKTAIIIDGVDECDEPMQLLRALFRIWETSDNLQVFLTSRLDVNVTEIFPEITTVRSDFSKTTSDITEYIRKELQRPERRNPKVITDELAERMVNILTHRAQGMFRWVELQLDLLISPERRIKYRPDFVDRLTKLEAGSGKEVLESLRETYDDIYDRNTQGGPHTRRLAEKALKWVLCAARPLKIWELGAAVSVYGEDKISTDLIVEICSNFFLVDARGVVQIAHLSVREYLEVKNVSGRLIYSREEANVEAAVTCLMYFNAVSQSSSANNGVDDLEMTDDDREGQSRNESQPPADDSSDREELSQEKIDNSEKEKVETSKQETKQQEEDLRPKEILAGLAETYDNVTSDYFHLVKEYVKTDNRPSLKPRRAYQRFQRYACVYWANHCEAAGGLRLNGSGPLKNLFRAFLSGDGSNPEFKYWAATLLNETRLTSTPVRDPAPMIFIPTTAHKRDILDAEPLYEKWQETVSYDKAPGALMPSIPLIACFYGFTEILQDFCEDGAVFVTQNHAGILGLVLASRSGHTEVLDLPIPSNADFDVKDIEGRTALHHAAISGHLELTLFLLGYPRSDINGTVKERLPSRSNVNARDLGGRTPLHYAAESGQERIIRLLLAEEDIDVHARNYYGATAILLSIKYPGITELLKADRRYNVEDELWLYDPKT